MKGKFGKTSKSLKILCNWLYINPFLVSSQPEKCILLGISIHIKYIHNIYQKYIKKCIHQMHTSKIGHLFLKELYFGFFHTFEDLKVFEGLEETEIPKYNSCRDECLIFDIY